MSTNTRMPAPRISRATSSTARGEGSEVIATSASATASRAVAATGPPSAAARAGSRSQATTACPAATRFLAIGRPIVPRPMKPIRATSRSIDAVRDFELADQAGRAFRLADALAEGAVLLVFYRGDF